MGMGSHLAAPATLTQGNNPPWHIKYEARWRRCQSESFGGEISCPCRCANSRASSPSRHVFRDLLKRLPPSPPVFSTYVLLHCPIPCRTHMGEKKYTVFCGENPKEKKNRLENLGAGGRPILQLEWGCVLDDTGSGQWRTQELFSGGAGFNKFSWGHRTERTGIWGRSPLFRGSGGSCNLVQEISFHIVKFS